MDVVIARGEFLAEFSGNDTRAAIGGIAGYADAHSSRATPAFPCPRAGRGMVQRLDAWAEDIVTLAKAKRHLAGPGKARRLSAEERSMTELVRARMKESHSSEWLGLDVESVHAGKAS